MITHLPPDTGPTRHGRAGEERRAALAPRTPAAAAQRSSADRLNAGPRVSAQLALAQTLNRAPAVARLAERGAALSRARTPEAGPVAQRFPWTTTALGVAGGAYLGSYLDPFLPARVGSIGGGVLGGVLGSLAPGLTRRSLSRGWAPEALRQWSFWGEVNQEGDDARTFHTPRSLADQLAEQSTAFDDLRNRARESVSDVHDRELGYVSRGGSYSGSFRKGEISIDTDDHPSVALANVVFETANAAQSGFFEQVRKDYEDDSIMKKGLDHYADLLQRDAADMDPYRNKYESGDKVDRRVLLQEWGEYKSLQLARDALVDVRKGLKGKTSIDRWEKGLWGELLNERTFEGYYDLRGVEHGSQVEHALRESSKNQ
jgi:hypothetical protein